MEEGLNQQLEQSKKSMLSRMEDRLSRLGKKAWEGFNDWCSQKVEDLKLRMVAKKQFEKIGRVFLLKSEKNSEAENNFIMRQYEQSLVTIISQHSEEYLRVSQHIRNKFHRLATEVISAEMEKVELRIRQKLKTVEREDKMMLVIISQLRQLENNRNLITESVEIPMLRELEAEEQRLRDRFNETLIKWEKKVIENKQR